MSNKSLRQTNSIISVIISLLILGLSGWLVLNRQFVFDKWSVAQYQPSGEILSIVDRAGFSEDGKFVFYASHPSVSASSDFNVNCKKQEIKSAILGCYSAGRIYIYDVPNTQLDGIEEVTAAHETLHAIWERMSDANRKLIGVLLEAEYSKLSDKNLQDRMAYYDRNEPGEHLNELHSILGTELSNIDPQLEAHYTKYFTDRSKVVALHAGYQQVFDGIEVRSSVLLDEINVLASDIKSDVSSYNQQAMVVSRESEALRARESSVDRSSQSEVNAYNATRQVIFDQIGQLETLRSVITSKSDLYDNKLAEYEKLIIRSNELTQSLDSTLAPAPRL